MNIKFLPWIGACLILAPLQATAVIQSPGEQIPAPILTDSGQTPHKALSHYNLGKKKLAIAGRDPVAYFSEFGGKPRKGNKSIFTVHKGVQYRFASEGNRTAFLADPTRFEPAYGGWCAWAIADGKGDKVDPDPESFTIEGGRLFLFYDGWFGDTRKSWRKKGGASKLEKRADRNWLRMTGERAPRSLFQWNVDMRMALQGFDPVAYAQGKAKAGDSKISARFMGVLYHFATQANRAAFLKTPDRFEAQFGGWCAASMVEGKTTKVDPQIFEIIGGKLYMFESAAKRTEWKQDSQTRIDGAGKAWVKLNG